MTNHDHVCGEDRGEGCYESSEFRLGGMLRRMVLLLLVIIAANVMRKLWPWSPYLGVAIALSYIVGRGFK